MPMRQPWVRLYRKSGRFAVIQHQLPLTGVIACSETATTLVMMGTNHVEAQMSAFAHTETSGRYVLRVMVRSVTRTIARIVKSTACTVSCPMKPFAVQAGPGFNFLVLI